MYFNAFRLFDFYQMNGRAVAHPLFVQCIRRSIYLAGMLFLAQPFFAQTPKKTPVEKSTEKVNEATQRVEEQTSKAAAQMHQASGNLQQAALNVKESIKVFEPILKLRLKKVQSGQQASDAASFDAPQTEIPFYDYEQAGVSQAYIEQQLPVVAQSPAYNTDGTANLGSQNNKKYGCYLDILNGAIMDDIDAAGNSRHIDLIFTATDYFNAQVPMYAFLTPAYAKNDAFAYTFFRGTKFKDRNIPPATWEEVNESEVAFAPITGEQFERIQTNAQLAAVVKQCTGFSQKVESRSKLDGKVLAVRTEMGDRTAYGLMYIVSHYGTTGENGYLKVKLKVTGFESNGDGNPDPGLYQKY